MAVGGSRSRDRSHSGTGYVRRTQLERTPNDRFWSARPNHLAETPVSTPDLELRDHEDQFAYDLRAAYDMEVKLVDALDEMSRRATDDDLAAGFALHRTETENQVRRVESAFEALGLEPDRRPDSLTDGLLAEREQFDDLVADDGVLNDEYLTAAMQTERIEITSYEGLLRTAEKAGLGPDVTGPLADNLAEEEKTLRKLQGLAAGSGGRPFWRTLTRL